MSKLLDQGGYGCVYRPEIKCSGKTGSNKMVSKLQKKNYASMNETNMGVLIRNIKNYNKYFLPAINSCPVQLSSIDAKILKPCEIINKKYQYILMQFPFLENMEFLQFFSNTKKPELHLIEMYEEPLILLKLLLTLYLNLRTHHIPNQKNSHKEQP